MQLIGGVGIDRMIRVAGGLLLGCCTDEAAAAAAAEALLGRTIRLEGELETEPTDDCDWRRCLVLEPMRLSARL